MKPELCKLLGLAEDVPDEEVLKALGDRLARLAEFEKPPGDEQKQATSIVALARKHTGKDKPEEIEAVLVGLTASRTATTDLATEVATLRQSQLRSDLREICRANPRKVANTKVEALVMASATTGAAQALVDALPEILHDPARPLPAPTPAPGGGEVTLTDEDRAVAKLTGTDPVKVLEFKKQKAAEQRA